MLQSRFVSQHQNAMRKSRLEGVQRPSLLPKPRRPGSTDRLSSEARRPSAVGHRSNSAEPPRGTFGGRLSREASATKLAINRRSKSQQGDKYGQSSMTPLRNKNSAAGKDGLSMITPMRPSHYNSRPTITPVRTPSGDRMTSWQNSLDRALAFVTIKDQRPLGTAAWQRAQAARVGEALAARSDGAGKAMTLIRPLTIARFVDIAAALLAVITGDAKLNTDNYVTKLPHLSKRLLYPGTVSKSWLKTVNTLHAFPHALALVAYLYDMVQHIELPVDPAHLYGDDELEILRREFLYKCFMRFQDESNGNQFDDLNMEYLQNLKQVLGNDDEKITELTQLIKKYEACLEDKAEAAARAEEARRVDRRDTLLAGAAAERHARGQASARAAAQLAHRHDALDASKHLDLEIERATAENQQLKHEVETQPLNVEQRTKYLDEVDYALRVIDSKQALAEQIAKMVLSKEMELARWQKMALDSCVEYKQQLIHLSAHVPHLEALAIDENELMSASCSERVGAALGALRDTSAALAQRRAAHARQRAALARQQAQLMEETRTKLVELKCSVEREQAALDDETHREAAEVSAAAAEIRDLTDRLQQLKQQQEEYARIDSELEFWENQDLAWRSRLAELSKRTAETRAHAALRLRTARERRMELLRDTVASWRDSLH